MEATAVMRTAATRGPASLLLAAACGADPGESAVPTAGLPPTTWVVEEPYPPGAPHVGWFAEVTATSGLDAAHVVASDDPTTRLFGAGVAAGDVDRDGLDDLVLAVGGGPPRLFRGLGGLGFEEVTAGADLGEQPASSARLADLDGDGSLDLLLGRDDLLTNPGTVDTVRLLRGSGDGTFTDVTASAGLRSRSHVKALGVGDVDSDGLLDLYVANFAAAPTDLTGREDELYRALGDGRFEEIGARSNLDRQGLTWVVAMFDPDGTGRRELFAGNDSFIEDDGSRPIEPAAASWGVVQDRLLVRQGTDADGYPVFAERADPAVNELRATMGALATDVDGDGLLDLYLSDFGRNELLLRQPDGSYLDATAAWGLEALSRDDSRCPPGGWDILCLLVSWGAVHEDLDLDGVRDLLVVNGQILTDDGRQPVAVWRGDADGGLSPVQTDLPWLDARSVLAHDLDGDGDLDLVVATWNGPFRVFENLVRGGSAGAPGFASLRLVGTSSAPDGSGARVEVTVGGRSHVVELGTGGTPYTAQPVLLNLGLGDAASASARITWPTGATQVVEIARDQVTIVDEPRWFSVSGRVVPADGGSSVEVVLTPTTGGVPFGPGHEVAIEASLGTWSGPVEDLGDGRYRRVLVAPDSPGLAVLTLTADGTTSRLQPRITFE